MTRHLYYLQMRRDVLEERIQLTADQALNLAALALEAEYDDYEASNHGRNYFMTEHYLPPRVLRSLGSVYVRDNLPALHEQHNGLEQTDAEFQFMKVLLLN